VIFEAVGTCGTCDFKDGVSKKDAVKNNHRLTLGEFFLSKDTENG
jgi:hypothetical protein